jgi:hypothetical protein
MPEAAIENLHVACDTWIGVFQPSPTDIVVLFIALKLDVLKFSRYSDAAHQACVSRTNINHFQRSAPIDGMFHKIWVSLAMIERKYRAKIH